jgi:hypothetical protein
MRLIAVDAPTPAPTYMRFERGGVRTKTQPKKRKAGRGTMNVGVTKLQWNYSVTGYKSKLAAMHNTHSTG